MLKNLKVQFCFTLIALFNVLNGATDQELRYENAIYESDIRTVVLLNEAGFNFPLVELNEPFNKLKLSFDQLTSERDFYQYTLIHCDANWERSSISKTQYLGGVGFESIDNSFFSNGTLTQYTHYEVNLPSENTKPTISGNYLLLVYRNFDENDIVLSRRIMVLESKGNVSMDVVQSNQVEFRQMQQQVNFTFNKTSGNYYIPNPQMDIKTVILRNGEWNSAIDNLKPQFIKGNSYVYNQMLGNQFDGINEYRYFDVRSLQVAQAGVKKRMNIGGQKHVWLIADKSRGQDRYLTWRDYNGRVFYDNKDLPSQINIESDYCFVHFTLVSPDLQKNIYLYGELTDWAIKDDFKLYYNSDLGQYECIVPLKQGYYNYMYVVPGADGEPVDYKPLEGSHSITENNYMVLVYHRNQAMSYDELIGYGLTNSVQGNNGR
jgi:hypothetical protein